MKIKRLIMLLLFLSLIALNAWSANPPQLISSIPADGHLTADPWTICVEFTFSEPMNESFMLRFSPDYLRDDHDLSSWSADGRTLHYCRSSRSDPLPVGSYWFKLNPAGYDAKFKAAATQIALPETTI
ncbi:MAG: hypothetical protein KAI69_07180, partial [Deltaproteobacteria bacterium]|nr:hypothetical protein [Deltaproteobacteria bacterium]